MAPQARRNGKPSAGAGGARGKRVVILASHFHSVIAQSLIDGARRTLADAGIRSRDVRVLQVPGAFELPVMAVRAARSRPRPDAIIALGALIRGETPQYDVIAHAVAQGLTHVSVTTGIPISFGVIVATTLAQAQARAGGSEGNRGVEAAAAALAVWQSLAAIR
ncbi:MAG: 6,7-dimethyl-8-ribityllumazine synthase [Candidatus Omnitrophica bacterium]|nr:6,7-dimethyl-8-ribityllumazine synthase [Candidatus Omnitrophota bacterium]